MFRTNLLMLTVIATPVTGALAQVSESGPVTMSAPMLATMPPKAGLSVQVENMDITPVKGAPFCAVITTEHTQPFADGNRIHTTDSSTLCRDSEGRTLGSRHQPKTKPQRGFTRCTGPQHQMCKPGWVNRSRL